MHSSRACRGRPVTETHLVALPQGLSGLLLLYGQEAVDEAASSAKAALKNAKGARVAAAASGEEAQVDGVTAQLSRTKLEDGGEEEAAEEGAAEGVTAVAVAAGGSLGLPDRSVVLLMADKCRGLVDNCREPVEKAKATKWVRAGRRG